MSNEAKTKGLDEKFCENCGAIIKIQAEICPKCGIRQRKPLDPNISEKSRLVAFLLCTFFGPLAAHRFYAGKIATGILQLFFGWLTLFIWNFIDWIMIVAGNFADEEGKPIKKMGYIDYLFFNFSNNSSTSLSPSL